MSTKRTNDVSPSTSAKKIRFDSKFNRDAPPAHYYHLGRDKYLTVKGFAGDVRIHLRQFKPDEQGCLFPTREGVTMTPLVWHSFCKELAFTQMPSRQGEISIIEDCLLVNGVMVNNDPHVVLQRYYVRNDFSRQFVPGIFLMNNEEWNSMYEMVDTIAKSILCVQFGDVFPCWVMNELAKQMPPSTTETSSEDVDTILTSSLAVLVSNHMSSNISELFKCFGCEQGYANQLGHDCLTLTRKEILERYDDRAIAKIDLCKLAKDFVIKNMQFANYVTAEFLANFNIGNLIESAKELYTANDPMEPKLPNKPLDIKLSDFLL